MSQFPYDDLTREQLRHAAELVVDAQFPSTSFLQRRLKVGYARATILLDALEARGVVGPPLGVRQRTVLKSPAQLGMVLAELDAVRPT